MKNALDGLRTVADVEARCAQIVAPSLFENMFGVKGDPDWASLTANLVGFESLQLRPRVLVGVEDRSLTTTALGTPISLPVILGPTGGLDAAVPEGQLPTLRAAGEAGTICVNPCLSDHPLRDVKTNARGPFWEQVWLFKDRAITEFFVTEAESCGALAIVLTVSNAGASTWRTDRGGPAPPSWWANRETSAPALRDYSGGSVPTRRELNDQIDPGASWADVDWLRSLTSLPLVIKGIQTREDALLAREHGAKAVVVSNHGGRFLQGTRGTIDIVPEVVDAVGSELEVFVDGGVRSGKDVLAALALGVRAVLIGRPAFWGSLVGGQAGVQLVLEIFRRELDASFGLSGIRDVGEVTPAAVYVSK